MKKQLDSSYAKIGEIPYDVKDQLNLQLVFCTVKELTFKVTVTVINDVCGWSLSLLSETQT